MHPIQCSKGVVDRPNIALGDKQLLEISPRREENMPRTLLYIPYRILEYAENRANSTPYTQQKLFWKSFKKSSCVFVSDGGIYVKSLKIIT